MAYYEEAVEAVRTGRFQDSLVDLERAADSPELDFGRREHARMLLGFARAQLDDWDGAIECFKKVLVNDFECLPAQTALGHAYLQKKMLPEALETYRTAVQRDARNVQARHGLGWTLLEEGREPDEALYQLQEALRLDPESAPIRDSVGWALFKLGDLEAAMEQLEEAVRRNPDHPVILEHRRTVMDALKKRGGKKN